MLGKITHENRDKHVAMSVCTKFQSIYKTSNFGTKFVQKNTSDKIFGKINMKIIVSM